MTHNSITAYNLPERVATYDADMALMHPNRSKMIDIALEVLPFEPQAFFVALDLGVGTGFFSHAVLSQFPNCHVLAIDGAQAMVDLAQVRLGSLVDRVDFRIGDFRQLGEFIMGQKGRLVFSSYALHHLARDEKLAVLWQALAFLDPGGWFLNADLITAPDLSIEKRIQEIRVDGILCRSVGNDARFVDFASTRRFLDDLEARDHDQPLALAEDLSVLREAGLGNASVFWLEYREAVMGGYKP